MVNIVLKEAWKLNALLFFLLWQYGLQQRIWRGGAN